MSTPINSKLGNWRVRRGAVLVTMLICAVIVLRFTFWRTDPATPSTELIYGAYALWGTTLTGYVFGVIVDDFGLRRNKPRRGGYSDDGYDSYGDDSFETSSSPRAI